MERSPTDQVSYLDLEHMKRYSDLNDPNKE